MSDATISSIMDIMDAIAPRHLAEQWDNVGLQLGNKHHRVNRVLVALDPSPQVVNAACSRGADLLITHHPLLFRPLKSIDSSTPVGAIIETAVKHGLSVFCAHTNLDSAFDGVNDCLAGIIGLKNTSVLAAPVKTQRYKLVLFVPVDHEQDILDALFTLETGKIGNYGCCSFRTQGKGTFKAGQGANPSIGTPSELVQTQEVRIETIIEAERLSGTVAYLKKRHPYETMAYDVYPLKSNEADHYIPQGLGRVGELERQIPLVDFARQVREKLGLKWLKLSGRADLPVSKVALCSGSGSSLVSDFFASGAQVYISGDLHYHNARDAQDLDLALIDIGHFASEHVIVDHLVRKIRKEIENQGLNVSIEPFEMEKDPFSVLH